MEKLKRVFSLNELDKYLLNRTSITGIYIRTIFEFLSLCFCISFGVSNLIEGPCNNYN